jgi:hypothetical protein
MEYWEEINNKLKPWVDTDLNKTVVDLFAGWKKGTYRFEIWHWFDEKLPTGIAEYAI